MTSTSEPTMSRRNPRTWLFLISLPLLFLAACGDGDEQASDTAGGGDCPVPDGAEAPEGSLLAEARQQGFLEVGFANEPPYGFEGPDGEPTGEAPEVAEVILCEMGIPEIRGTVVDFGALIAGLNAGRYDMIAAGMFITPERAEQILFSDPDYCGLTSFAVPEGNPAGLTDFTSVVESDVELGVLSGAVEDEYAVGAGVPEDRINRFDSATNLFDALAAGRVDAVALTDVSVNTQVANLPGFESTESFVPVIDAEEQLGCGAYGFRFENEEFVERFDQVLDELQANGEILPIIEEFGFTQASVDRAKDVTAEDLS